MLTLCAYYPLMRIIWAADIFCAVGLLCAVTTYAQKIHMCADNAPSACIMRECVFCADYAQMRIVRSCALCADAHSAYMMRGYVFCAFYAQMRRCDYAHIMRILSVDAHTMQICSYYAHIIRICSYYSYYKSSILHPYLLTRTPQDGGRGYQPLP